MYSIAVKIDGIEARRRSAGLLHIVLGFFLIFKCADIFRYLRFANFVNVLPVFIIASISLFYGFFRKRMDPTSYFNFWIRILQIFTFTILGFVMIKIGNVVDYTGLFIFAFLCLLVLFSEKRIFLDTVIIIEEKGVHIPGYYKEHFVPWKDLSNVVVREDFLTFFHKKQKYLQYQVMQTLSPLELAKMNAFCKDQIENASREAVTNN
jgi:hypothetical protein